MTTADYLESLQDDLERTVEALELEEGTNFTDIADMAENGDISTSGGSPDFSQYYTSIIKQGSTGNPGIYQSIIEIPIPMSPYNNNLNQAFTQCFEMTISPVLINTSNVTRVDGMFRSCTKLKTVRLFDTSNVTIFDQFLFDCPLLENIPQFDLSKATVLSSFLSGGRTGSVNLTNESLNNLLGSLAGATSYTGTKTLAYIFGNNNMKPYYPASTIESLSNYTAFTNAGWTIGWS